MSESKWNKPTFMESVRIDASWLLLNAVWKVLPLRHPAWRGVWMAVQAIKAPALAEENRPDFEFTKAAFDDLCQGMVEMGRAQERERCLNAVEGLDCAHLCGVGHEIAAAIKKAP